MDYRDKNSTSIPNFKMSLYLGHFHSLNIRVVAAAALTKFLEAEGHLEVLCTSIRNKDKIYYSKLFCDETFFFSF